MKKLTGLSVLQTLALASLCFNARSVYSDDGSQQTTDIEITIYDTVLHEIDPRLFGQFMERPSWGEIGAEAAVTPGTHELRPEAEQLLRRMEIPIARFPGGTDVDYVDWRDMIDNVPGREGERPITVGHKGDRVTNYFGYDEFLQFCEGSQIEPILVVNFREGLLAEDGPHEAAEHAAKLIAYCNASEENNLPEELAVWPALRVENGRSAAYDVKYVQIGNETWAFSRSIDHERYIAAIETYIRAIRAVDPNVEFIVDGQPADLAADLAAEMHRRFGDQIAYYAVHHYQPWQINEIQQDGRPVDVESLSARDIWYAWVTVPRIDNAGQSVLFRNELNQARELGYFVAMTEWNWNGWWGRSIADSTEPSSLFTKGVGAAGLLHAMIRQGDVIRIGAQSMLIGDRWGIHSIYCDRDGSTPPYMIPSGQVVMLYSQHHGNQRLKLDLTGVPYYEQPYRMGGNSPAESVAFLDVLATRNEETLYVHAINRHFDEALTAQIDVSALTQQPGLNGKLYSLEGRLQNAPESGESPQPGTIRDSAFRIDRVRFPVRLPARSVNVIEIPLPSE